MWYSQLDIRDTLHDPVSRSRGADDGDFLMGPKQQYILAIKVLIYIASNIAYDVCKRISTALCGTA